MDSAEDILKFWPIYIEYLPYIQQLSEYYARWLSHAGYVRTFPENVKFWGNANQRTRASLQHKAEQTA